MTDRERIVAQYLLLNSGTGKNWAELSAEAQEEYLEDARAYILRADASLRADAAEATGATEATGTAALTHIKPGAGGVVRVRALSPGTVHLSVNTEAHPHLPVQVNLTPDEARHLGRWLIKLSNEARPGK